jgi:hypothetical protein
MTEFSGAVRRKKWWPLPKIVLNLLKKMASKVHGPL